MEVHILEDLAQEKVNTTTERKSWSVIAKNPAQ
mgnify:CR=1 FL=1